MSSAASLCRVAIIGVGSAAPLTAGCSTSSCAVLNRSFTHSSGVLAAGPAKRGLRPGVTPAAPAPVQPSRGTTLANLGLGPVAGLGGAQDSGAAQAFFRSRWPVITALGLGASALLGYSVFHEPQVTQRVYLDWEVDGEPAGRVVVGLFGREAPMTCENFAALASHERGFGYRGCPVHRLMRGWSVWTGDVTSGDGRGGVSVFGPNFPLEAHLRHRRGSVSMVLDEEGRLRSQFFFTLVTTPALDRKAAAFGRVLEGIEVLDRLSCLPVHEGEHADGRPRADVRIKDCGLLHDEGAPAGSAGCPVRAAVPAGAAGTAAAPAAG